MIHIYLIIHIGTHNFQNEVCNNTYDCLRLNIFSSDLLKKKNIHVINTLITHVIILSFFKIDTLSTSVFEMLL